MDRIQVQYRLQGSEIEGKLVFRTGYSRADLEPKARRTIIRGLLNIGIDSLSEEDVDILSVGEPDDVSQLQETPQAPSGQLYKLVAFSYKGEPGPLHLLAGAEEIGGCVCGTSRDPQTIVQRVDLPPGEKWAGGKYCVNCHKAWASRERNRMAEERAARKRESAA